MPQQPKQQRQQKPRLVPIRMDARTGAEFLSMSPDHFHRLANLGCFGDAHTDCFRHSRNCKKYWLTEHIIAYVERQSTIDPVERLQELEDAYRDRAARAAGGIR